MPEFDQLRERMNRTTDADEKFEALVDILAEFFRRQDDMSKDIKEMKTTLEPIAEAYKGFVFGKKFLTGVATVMLALAAIGGFMIGAIDFVTKKP